MITKNFIKQCEQAEELQAWYKSDVKNVREGDRYICRCNTCKNSMYVHIVKDSDIDYINERDMTDVDPTYAAMVSLSGVGEFGAFWDDGGFIWLPTLERLFEMAEIKDAVDFKCNFLLEICHIRQDEWGGLENYYDSSKTIYEIIFKYLMKARYSKIWTGEKWVKDND